MLGLESDSGITGPKYATMIQTLGDLVKQYPSNLQMIQYGQTPQGRPLIAIKITTQQTRYLRAQGAPAILLTGSTHGNEYLNIEDRMPIWFATQGLQSPELQNFFKMGGTVYLVPIYNPDGYDNRRRENSNGVDLNRDFSVKQANFQGFKQPESIAMRDFMNKEIAQSGRKLLFSIDYHCCIGAALYPWSFQGAPKVDPASEQIFLGLGKIIKSFFGANFQVGTTPNILGYSAVGTSKDYYFETYGSYSFTFEGLYGQENKRFDQHVLMWKALISQFTDAYRRSLGFR